MCRAVFWVQLIPLWIRGTWQAALALEGCTGSSADRLWEEVTVVGLRASGDVVAPKDSLAVESWSLRKNESGK